ncbi:hypothetical protein HDV06_002953 [Boothiomyces sp. JEL0866]|nr:hypothetical protein HDV06_002953 [Boothiomyces sp. JEL0866]
MSKMDFDLLTSAQSRLNPMNERELDLRGLKIQKIENLALTRDVNDCLDFTDNDIAKLVKVLDYKKVTESERVEALKLFSGKEGNELLKELTEQGMNATFDPEEILETKKTISKEEQMKIREAIKNAKTLDDSLFIGSRDSTISQWQISNTKIQPKNKQVSRIKNEKIRVSFDDDLEGKKQLGYDKQVELNLKNVPKTGDPTHLKSFEKHSDWVNDLVLYQKKLVSCSSDRSVLLWDIQTRDVVRLGYHGDYVKRLAQPKEQKWVASGSLDRGIFIWDLQEGRYDDPRILARDENPSGSIYALACNPTGTLIASGQGHSDAIRDLLISEDGKWVLSCSSDKSIKLWSLAMPNHCVETYNYCEDSVWCLHTNSPTFANFWAGTKDGWVYKINTESKYDTDCIAICQEKDPILKIAATEDSFIWTATTSSTVNRYRDVPFFENDELVIPDECCIKPDMDVDTESIYSKPVSIHSYKEEHGSLTNTVEQQDPDDQAVLPCWTKPFDSIQGVPGIKKYLIFNNKRFVLTENSVKQVCLWDIITCEKINDFGKADFDKVANQENSQEWVANWCTIDTKNGDLTVHLDEGRCLDSEIYHQDLDLLVEASNEDQRVNLAKWVLTYLVYNYLKRVYPNNASFTKNAGQSMRENDPNTPSMKVMLATPLSLNLPDEPNGLLSPGIAPSGFSNTNLISAQGNVGLTRENSSTDTNTPPLQVVIPEEQDTVPDLTSPLPVQSPEAASPKKGSQRSPSFIDKFKFLKNRNNSVKSTEEHLPPPPEPTIQIPLNEEFINLDETPPLLLNQNIPIIFSVEQSPSMYVDTFKGKLHDLSVHPNIGDVIPGWVKDWIVNRNQPQKDAAKLAFILTKHPRSQLQELSQEYVGADMSNGSKKQDDGNNLLEQEYDIQKQPNMDQQQFFAFAAAAAAQYGSQNINNMNPDLAHMLIQQQRIPDQSYEQTPEAKPTVGSQEHIRLKKETHREVERRRRENINAGIQELAELIPGQEKNKGRILQRAVQYIHELKQQDSANMEKWSLEKMLYEQTIQDYLAQVEALKQENHRLRQMLPNDNGNKRQRTDDRQ